MEGPTRIRDLRRPYGTAVIPAWPPRWVPSYDGTSILPIGEDGFLTWVERMPNGPGLWLTMRLDGVARRGPLLWSGWPSLLELERVLKGQIGRGIRDIGFVEIDPEAMPKAMPEAMTESKPIVAIARSGPPWST